MAITRCISLSNQEAMHNIDETGTHGTPDFPVAIYLDDVTENHVNWHWHREFEIGFVEEGDILLGCGNRKYNLSAGDIFFVNSDVLHAMRNLSASQPAIFKSVAFDGSIIGGTADSIFYKRYLQPILRSSNLREFIWTSESEQYHRLLSLLQSAWQAVYCTNCDYEISVRNCLSDVFSILIHINEKSAPDSAAAYQLQESRVQIILNCIHSGYGKQLSLEDLAAAANVSKSEVLRCFKAIIGISPIQYLKNHRLQNAAYMLKSTVYSIQTICELCGFEDNSYFSKSFKEKYHCTPREYRGK